MSIDFFWHCAKYWELNSQEERPSLALGFTKWSLWGKTNTEQMFKCDGRWKCWVLWRDVRREVAEPENSQRQPRK